MVGKKKKIRENKFLNFLVFIDIPRFIKKIVIVAATILFKIDLKAKTIA